MATKKKIRRGAAAREKKSSRAVARPTAAKTSIAGSTVRRHDKNGRAYYIDRQSGRRVSADVWQRERRAIAKAKANIAKLKKKEKAKPKSKAKAKPKSKARKKKVVVTPGELLRFQLLRLREKHRKEIAKERPIRGVTQWISTTAATSSFNILVPIRMEVTESNVEEIVYRCMNAARAVNGALPRGGIYASPLYLLEYGNAIVGSPKTFFSDEEGEALVGSVEGVSMSGTLQEFEEKLRQKLDKVMSNDFSVVWFEFAVIRSIVDL